MRKRIFFLSILFSLLFVFANAGNSDSLTEQQLIREGRAQFCRMLDQNDEAIAQHHPEQMQFVVMLSGEESVDRVLSETTPGHMPDPAGQGALKDSLNAKLQRIYSNYGVELYILVISSLDVIVSSPLPNNVTISQLFTQKLYDDRTNLQAMRAKHESITNGIISSTIKGRNRDCLVLSDCSYCGAFFPNNGKGCRKFASVFTNESSPSTYADIRSLSRDFCYRLKSSNMFINGGDYSMPEAVKLFEESAKYFRTKANILQTYYPADMSALLDEFGYTLDFEELTYAEREHILSVYAGFSMDGSWMYNGSGEEGHVLQVLKYVRKEDVADLLAILSGPSSLRNNPNYHGDKNDDALIRQLMHRMDDAFLSSDNNYTAMVQVLTHHMVTNEQVFNEHLPTADADWLNRRIYWYDTYTLSEPPVGTHHYSVTLNDNGSIGVQKKVVDRQDVDYNNAAATAHYTSHWDEDYPPLTFQPFDLIFFTNRSSVSMLQAAGAQQEQVFVAPAVFLKYASDKTFNATTVQAIAVSLDVIALATGPGAIASAMEASNLALAAFEALQLTGAAANLVVNNIQSPALQSVVEKYNMIVGMWGLTHVLASGMKFTVDFFSEVRAGNVKQIPAGVAEDFKQSYSAAGGELNELDEATRGKLKKMEEYLGGAGGLVEGIAEQRTAFWNDWVAKCFPNRNWAETVFETQGMDYETFKSANSAINEEMKSLYPTTGAAEQFLPSIIQSGSTAPVRTFLNEGEKLYKIVPKGGNINSASPYYLAETEYMALKANPANLEQMLGLPLSSVAAEYDVFTITSKVNNNVVYQSTVAGTKQYARATPAIVYSTSGGATQTLVVNSQDLGKWVKSTVPIETFSPNTLPQLTH